MLGFAGVAEAGQLHALRKGSERGEEARERMRPSDLDDVDALGGEIASLSFCEAHERDAVALPFDDDDAVRLRRDDEAQLRHGLRWGRSSRAHIVPTCGRIGSLSREPCEASRPEKISSR
jgi:hypothetical protein